MKILNNDMYLLLIDEEAEIKEGDIAIHDFGMGYKLEIPCDEDNLESNTRHKVIAYYPLSEEAKELDLPLLPPFEVDIEKLALGEVIKMSKELSLPPGILVYIVKGFILGYKAALPKQFTVEDMKEAFNAGYDLNTWEQLGIPNEERDYSNEHEYIQSLSTQKLPSEFIPEYDLMNEGYNKPEDYPYQECKVLKTIINSEGKEVVQGKYVYS